MKPALIKHLKILIVLLLGIFLLSACAPIKIKAPSIEASPEKLSKVKSITVIRPLEPSYYEVSIKYNLIRAYGPVANHMADKSQQEKQAKLKTALQDKGIVVSSTLADKVTSRLRASGFDVTIRDGAWREDKGRTFPALEKIESKADAILIMNVGVGFYAANPMSDYLPHMSSIATLYGSNREHILYRSYYCYGCRPEPESWQEGGWKVIVSDVSFSNFDALMKGGGSTLSEATDKIADSIVSDLIKNNFPRSGLNEVLQKL